MIAIFNYDNYLKNPVAEYCVAQLPNPTIFTLDDLMPDIQKLHHARESYKNVYIDKNKKSLPSFIGDQIRLYYSLLYDNYFYCDADVFITKEMQDKIWANKNCIYYSPEKKEINNGTFFCSDKGSEFNQYYFDLYENKDLKDMTNMNVYFTYPYKVDYENKKAGDMNLLDIPVKHFCLSKVFSFKKFYDTTNKPETIYYTYKKFLDLYDCDKEFLWQLGPHADEIHIVRKMMRNKYGKIMSVYQWNTAYEFIPEDVQFDLWKEQIKYTLQNPNIKFEEV